MRTKVFQPNTPEPTVFEDASSAIDEDESLHVNDDEMGVLATYAKGSWTTVETTA